MASPEVEFLEERLALLETWLESTKDDENNEDLIQKCDEYRNLIDETVLLQKKLRKTSKLLSTENSEKMLQKLSKKQDQYLSEIEEIMNYAESDVLFETAEIEPNELLGEPLETLLEQPGMEGSSSSLNFSMSDFMPKKVAKTPMPSSSDFPEGNDLTPIAESSGGSTFAKCNESINSISTGLTTLFTISTADSNTYNYDVKTLQKKLKKVESLLATEETNNSNTEISPLDAKQLKKLKKKREQYAQALEYKLSNGNESLKDTNEMDGMKLVVEESNLEEDSNDDCRGKNNDELEEFEKEEDGNSNNEQSHHGHVSNNKNHDCNGSASYDQKTLKKKLKKLRTMMAASSDAKELELYKKKKKEYKTALELLRNQEMGIDVPLSSEHVLQEEGKVNNAHLSPTYSVDSYSNHDKQNSGESDHQIELLRKKIRKADKSIAKARKEDDPKKLKKIEKKRLEYEISLTELLNNR